MKTPAAPTSQVPSTLFWHMSNNIRHMLLAKVITWLLINVRVNERFVRWGASHGTFFSWPKFDTGVAV